MSEARQLFPDTAFAIAAWVEGHLGTKSPLMANLTVAKLAVRTPQGICEAVTGDWIICEGRYPQGTVWVARNISPERD